MIEIKEFINIMSEQKRILTRAFFINIIMIIIVYLFSENHHLVGFLSGLAKCTPEQAYIYLIFVLGFWFVASIFFFGVPSIAMRKSIKKAEQEIQGNNGISMWRIAGILFFVLPMISKWIERRNEKRKS